jgi:CDP-paratose 2-epimerase
MGPELQHAAVRGLQSGAACTVASWAERKSVVRRKSRHERVGRLRERVLWNGGGVNILVTGGLGALGSRYAEHAAKAGHQVEVVDCGTDLRHLWTRKRIRAVGCEHIEYMRSRIEEMQWARVLEDRQTDAIVHAAAHTGIPHSAEDPDDDWRSNVDATRAILEGLRKTKRRIPMVALSSVKPYRVDPARMPVDEDTPLEPDEPYAASKAAQSMLCMAYARQYDLPVTVLRCSNLYADAPCHGPRHGWLTWFCIAAAIGRPIEIQGDGSQRRDMLFTDDVSAGIDAALANIEAMRGQVYNMGGGPANVISVRDAVAEIGRVLGREGEVVFAPRRKNDDDIFVTDTRKLYAVTGWTARVSPYQGIVRVLAWAHENRDALRAVYA